MEDSILTSTKKILGLSENYTAFDEDIVVHINSTFDILSQLGIEPAEPFRVEDATQKWTDFGLGPGMNMIRSYVFLKVRLMFDPPPTSFGIEAAKNQIEEYEWRLSTQREWLLDPNDPRSSEGVNS